MLPARIGSYSIIRLLGEGGMGAVYEAVQDTIERRVAIKVLLTEHCRHGDALQRFFNEARAANRIEHPGIVQISEFGQTRDGIAYLVMEHLRGEALNHRLQRLEQARQRMPLDAVLYIGLQVADALAAAHNKGIIHRDIKPSNLMLVPDVVAPGGERVKILDFGIAKLSQKGDQGTHASALIGTPQYMSPEQFRGAGSVDDRTDVYSLGVVLYQMLAGRPPFLAEDPVDYMAQHVFKEPSPLRELAPGIPVEVALLVHRLLIKDKAVRPTMPLVREELARLLPPLSSPGFALPAFVAPSKSGQIVPSNLAGTASNTLSTLGHSHGQTARFVRRLGLRSLAITAFLIVGTGLGLVALFTSRPSPSDKTTSAARAPSQPPDPGASVPAAADLGVPTAATVKRSLPEQPAAGSAVSRKAAAGEPARLPAASPNRPRPSNPTAAPKVTAPPKRPLRYLD